MPIAFEPLAPDCREDPYPLYRELREREPVHWAPGAGMFCLSRHADVRAALEDAETFSSSAMNSVLTDMAPLRPRFLLGLLGFLFRTRVNPFEMQRRGSMIAMDAPRHDVMRRIVNRGFVPRRIAAWESRARELAVGSLAGLRAGRPFDVIGELAIPLPVTIIAEMLGIEASRRHDFKRWSDVIIHVASGAARGSSSQVGRLVPVFTELFTYLQEQVRRRQASPADDLISVIVDPQREDALDELDAIQFVVLLLLAGNETTTNLIGNAVHALLDRPEILARMSERPQDVPAVVEEALRFDPPIQMVFRETTRDVRLHGTRIPAGSVVALLLGSANHDERVFGDPERFDPDRDTRAHLGFGFGSHFCLGSALARLEARVALEALAPELVRCKRVGEAPELVDSFLVRGRARLDVEPVAGWEAAGAGSASSASPGRPRCWEPGPGAGPTPRAGEPAQRRYHRDVSRTPHDEKIARWARDGRTGSAPVAAATVVVLRERQGDLETLMLRRNSKIAFGGMWVFPGGRVDPEDAAGLAADDELAIARAAAVREAREEAGLLISADSLVPLSHWTPPPITPRRFLTWFFLAPAPADEITIDHGEIHEHAWLSPAQALAKRDAGEIELAPPTFVSLYTLARAASLADALERARAAVPERFETHIAVTDEGPTALWHGDAGWEAADASLPGPRHRLVMGRNGWRYQRSTSPGDPSPAIS